MDNTLSAAELERRGMAAIEEGPQRGPVHLLERNRAAAVVVSAQEYRRLTSGQERAVPGMTALQLGPDHVLLTGDAAFARVQGLAVKLLR